MTIQVKKEMIRQLVTHEIDEVKLPYNQYQAKKLNIEKNGHLQEVKFTTGGRGHRSSCVAIVAIARVGYWFILKIKLIERISA